MEAVKVFTIKPAPPEKGLGNFETERILKGFPSEISKEELSFEYELLKKLPFLIRASETLYGIAVKEEKGFTLVDLKPEEPAKVLGCAIDLGSTTMAFYFYDFLSKKVIKEFSLRNPQLQVGEDILTRLHFARKSEGLKYLQEITLRAINEAIKEEADNLYFISLCGNTAMTHFFLGLPVNYLIVEPYVAVSRWFPLLKARELGLEINPLARVFVFPLGGTYFGGDLIAGLFETRIFEKEGFYFYLDVGTNAEVVLGNKDFLLACAGAAGPALEGGIFECGTYAREGAITEFRYDNEAKRFRYQVLGGGLPLGFCGSAAIKLIAELFLMGLITSRGEIIKEKLGDLYMEIEGERAIKLVPEEETLTGRPIYLKEGEIKSFLRSKGAMFSILSLLCEKVGITFKEIEAFYVAGTFGEHIDVNSAVILGMLPEEALDKAIALGNSAGKGALKFLLNPNFEEVRKIAENITYLELNVEPRFFELLTGALLIPHVNLELFPRIKRLIEERSLCFRQ